MHCNSRQFDDFQNLRLKSVFSSQNPFPCQILGLDIGFLRFYVNFHDFSMIFDMRTLHCNSRRFENFQNLRSKSVFSSQKPFPYQILRLDIHFLMFSEGLCSFRKMAACHTIQYGGINVGRVY